MKKSSVLSKALIGALLLATATGIQYSNQIGSFLSSAVVAQEQVAIIEFAAPPTMETLFALRKQVPQAISITRFDKFESDYFRRAYQVTFNGEFNALQKALTTSGVAIKRIELVQAAKLSSLVPGTSRGNGKGADPLSNYQWALSNDGQKILREIDDIHSQTIVADPNGPRIDIGLGAVRARMATEAKRDMIVAVVDSGLDTSHEDIAKNILVNKAECDGDKIPFQPKDDKDGNGYKGDCMGWNFTTAGDGDNQVDDDLGHGTHVAGIIAAEIGNGIGVAGVAPRIKILPIKVTGDKDSGRAMTNRAAKAILYAVKMKADVVNFSLGWPNSVDTEFLRQSFAEARKAGVTIIAAAGNNTSAAPVFPCSYEGVICVGAATISGEVANFSNYGGHVDVLAPGEEILSLNPKGMEPKNFSVRGYEIKNGTSQAAPYVSAQAAVLKALIPNISPDEIQARLIATTKAIKWQDKFGMNGLTDLSAALALKAQPVLRPVFKRIYQVSFTMDDKDFQFDLPIKNFWAAAADSRVDLSIDTPNLTIDQPSVNLGAIGTGETKSIHVNGHIQSTDARREARLIVKITSGGKTETYSQQIVLSRDLENDREVKTYPITLNQAQPALNMMTVTNVMGDQAYPEYFTGDSDDKGVTLNLIRYKNGGFVQERPLLLPGTKGLLFVFRVDVNYDGKDDYVIETVGQTGDQKWIQLSFVDQNFQPIFGKQQDIRLEADAAVLDKDGMRTLGWVPTQTPFGKIAMPIFRTAAWLPKIDMNPDPFAFEKNSKAVRVYYYTPKLTNGTWTLATHAYDNTKWLNAIRESLGLRFRTDLSLSTLVPQTKVDFLNGRIRAFVTTGTSSLRSYRMITMTGTDQLNAKGYKLESTNFQGQTFDGAAVISNATDLSNTVPDNKASPIFASFFSGKTGRLTMLDGADPSRIAATQQASPERAQDTFMGSGLVKAYQSGLDLIGFYQTKSRIIVRKTSGSKAVQSSDSLDRTSLIDSSTFDLQFYPITAGEAGRTKVPAIYLDATQIFANRVYVWTYENGVLSAPMKLNVNVPKGCRALAPSRFGSGGETAYIFLCTEKGSNNASTFTLKTLTVQ